MAKVETNRSKVLARLKAEGWLFHRHGSEHDIYRHPERGGIVSVPRHRVLSPGVARSISKGAGWH